MASDPIPAPQAAGAGPVQGLPVAPAFILYGLTKARHPTYDAKLIMELADQYRGGYTMMRKADTYLVKMLGESDQRYEERKLIATYQNHFGQIVDQFSSDVFSQSLTVTPPADAANTSTPGTDTKDDYWTAFAKKADQKKKSFSAVMKDVLTTALIHKRGLVMADAPRSDVVPTNLAEEEKLGLGQPYIYELPIESLVNWETDEEDKALVWAMVRKVDEKQASPFAGGRNRITETFTVWGMSEPGAGGKRTAEWARYSISYDKDKAPKDDDPVKFIDRGDTKFGRIPIHTLELPDGLWVGNKIGPNALEYFRRRSALVSAENRSLCVVPTVKLGNEIGPPGGEMPGQAQQNTGRGRAMYEKLNSQGYLILGSGDDVEFPEPTGACYGLVDGQLKDLRDEMFAVNHQMAASVRPTDTALGRSGLSKQKDTEVTEKVLDALGEFVRDFAVEVYDCISTARGETIKWAAHGLEGYQVIDRESLLEEAISMDEVAIPSPTFRQLQKTDVAIKLTPNATPAEHDLIRKEIVEGVKAEQEIRDLVQEAEKDAIENPPPPPVPPTPPGVPPVKPPAAAPPVAKPPPQPGSKAA